MVWCPTQPFVTTNLIAMWHLGMLTRSSVMDSKAFSIPFHAPNSRCTSTKLTYPSMLECAVHMWRDVHMSITNLIAMWHLGMLTHSSMMDSNDI